MSRQQLHGMAVGDIEEREWLVRANQPMKTEAEIFRLIGRMLVKRTPEERHRLMIALMAAHFAGAPDDQVERAFRVLAEQALHLWLKHKLGEFNETPDLRH
jgi:hypothetical protein